MWRFLVEIVLAQESVQYDIDHARSFRLITPVRFGASSEN